MFSAPLLDINKTLTIPHNKADSLEFVSIRFNFCLKKKSLRRPAGVFPPLNSCCQLNNPRYNIA